jgi:hypothetical protein
MSEPAERIQVDRAVPAHRDTEDALLFFTLPGMRIYAAAWHSKDSVRFVAVT